MKTTTKQLLEQQATMLAQDKTKVRTANGERYKVKTFDIDEEGNPNSSLTRQSEKDQTDLNKIIKKAKAGEIITHVNEATAQYFDNTEVNEFQVSMNIVANGTQAFEQLPSDIRKKFHNDAGEFLEFACDPDNAEKMIKLGLATKPKGPFDSEGKIIPPTATKAVETPAETTPPETPPTE